MANKRAVKCRQCATTIPKGEGSSLPVVAFNMSPYGGKFLCKPCLDLWLTWNNLYFSVEPWEIHSYVRRMMPVAHMGIDAYVDVEDALDYFWSELWQAGWACAAITHAMIDILMQQRPSTPDEFCRLVDLVVADVYGRLGHTLKDVPLAWSVVK